MLYSEIIEPNQVRKGAYQPSWVQSSPRESSRFLPLFQQRAGKEPTKF